MTKGACGAEAPGSQHARQEHQAQHIVLVHTRGVQPELPQVVLVHARGRHLHMAQARVMHMHIMHTQHDTPHHTLSPQSPHIVSTCCHHTALIEAHIQHLCEQLGCTRWGVVGRVYQIYHKWSIGHRATPATPRRDRYLHMWASGRASKLEMTEA